MIGQGPVGGGHRGRGGAGGFDEVEGGAVCGVIGGGGLDKLQGRVLPQRLRLHRPAVLPIILGAIRVALQVALRFWENKSGM